MKQSLIWLLRVTIRLRLGLLWGNISNQVFLQDIGEDLFEEVDNDLDHVSSFVPMKSFADPL